MFGRGFKYWRKMRGGFRVLFRKAAHPFGCLPAVPQMPAEAGCKFPAASCLSSSCWLVSTSAAA